MSGVAAVPPLESVADPGSYPLPDLAVLDVEEAAGWGHPCAALATGSRCWAVPRMGCTWPGTRSSMAAARR